MNVPLTALITVWLAAQAPCGQQGPGEILGLVRTESGRGVGGAHVRFVPDPDGGFAWNQPPETLPEAVVGESGADGRFRFPTPAAATGCLVVEHDSGVGAVVPAVATGMPAPVVVRALGSVTVRGASTFAADIRLVRPGARSAWLGTSSGAELRLPAGRYLLLVRVDGARAERTVTVHAGTRTEIEPPAGAGPAVALPEAVRVELGRWPALEARDAESHLPVLEGPDVLRAVLRPRPGVLVCALGWVQPDAVVRVPVADGEFGAVALQDADGAPIPAGAVFTVVEEPGGPRVLARSTARGGEVPVWRPAPDPSGNRLRVVLIAVAPGRRPAIAPAEESPGVLRLEAARPVAIRLQGPAGEMVAGATVRVRSAEDPLLDRVLRSDARGIVRIPDAPGDAVDVEIHPREHLPATARVPLGAEAGMPVVALEAGLVVHGMVRTAPDGAAAPGVEVQLRDTTGELGVDTRIAVTDGDGAFRFPGLPDGIYTVFAQRVVDGVTWSGIARGVQPGRDEWLVELRNEDPVPPHRRR